MSYVVGSPVIPIMSAMSPLDAAVPFTFDFSSAVAATDTIASIAGVTAAPSGLTIGTPVITTGVRAACAVQVTLGLGAAGTYYTVTTEVRTAQGIQLARSVYVPVSAR